MYPNNFFTPYNMTYQAPFMANSLQSIPRMANMANSGGLFSRLGRGISSVNWSGLLNNASKTLGVINQAIPIVRQTGPMLNNMRSMLKVARVFRDETSNNSSLNNNNNSNSNNENTNINNNVVNNQEKRQDINYNNTSPNFFI